VRSGKGCCVAFPRLLEKGGTGLKLLPLWANKKLWRPGAWPRWRPSLTSLLRWAFFSISTCLLLVDLLRPHLSLSCTELGPIDLFC
jgi:hypothetical protein